MTRLAAPTAAHIALERRKLPVEDRDELVVFIQSFKPNVEEVCGGKRLGPELNQPGTRVPQELLITTTLTGKAA